MGSYSSQKLGLQTCVNVRSGPEEQGAAVCISNLCTKLLLVHIWFLILKWFIFPEVADNYYYRLTLGINTPGVGKVVHRLQISQSSVFFPSCYRLLSVSCFNSEVIGQIGKHCYKLVCIQFTSLG